MTDSVNATLKVDRDLRRSPSLEKVRKRQRARGRGKVTESKGERESNGGRLGYSLGGRTGEL